MAARDCVYSSLVVKRRVMRDVDGKINGIVGGVRISWWWKLTEKMEGEMKAGWRGETGVVRVVERVVSIGAQSAMSIAVRWSD